MASIKHYFICCYIQYRVFNKNRNESKLKNSLIIKVCSHFYFIFLFFFWNTLYTGNFSDDIHAMYNLRTWRGNEKGLKILPMAASKKKETKLTQTLKDLQNRGTPVHVHHDCRRRLTDFRKKPVGPETKRLRSSIDAAFAWKICCFLCSMPIVRN